MRILLATASLLLIALACAEGAYSAAARTSCQSTDEPPLERRPTFVVLSFTQYGFDPPPEELIPRGRIAVGVRNSSGASGLTLTMTVVKRNGRTKVVINAPLEPGLTLTPFRKWKVGEKMLVRVTYDEVVYEKTVTFVARPQAVYQGNRHQRVASTIAQRYGQ